MAKPTECKWCGCRELITYYDVLQHFRCGSAYWPGNNEWTSKEKCRERMASQAEILRDRIRQAVEALGAIQRHEVTPYSSRQVSWERTSDGPWVLQRDVEAVVDDLVRVLEGET